MLKTVIAIVAVVALIVVGIVAYSFLKTPEAATGPIEAIPLATEAQQPAATDTGSQTIALAEATQPATSTPEPEKPATAEAPTETASTSQEDVAPTETAPSSQEEAAPTAPPEPTKPAEDTAAGPTTFEILPAESEARFLIDEVLRGSDVTVVGSTDQAAGQLAIDPGDLSSAQVGTIQVNARTITTDNEFRNRAIKNRILRTDDYEFVTFVPKEIVGLSGSGSAGETYDFQIVGDLTITDVTREVTFEVTVTPVSETRIEGLATTTFLYTDFELSIPDSPSVDTVEDTVRLEFEFVAEAIQ
jgi:polyisoprenoid-binding protein YceI